MSGLLTKKGDDFPADYLPVSNGFKKRLYNLIEMLYEIARGEYDDENSSEVRLFADNGYGIGVAVKAVHDD